MRANNLKSVSATKPQSSHLSAYVLQQKKMSSLAKPASRLCSEMSSLCKYPPPPTARWPVHPSLAVSPRVSDHFEDVARHEASLLPARHSDEAAVLALATHAYLGTGNNITSMFFVNNKGPESPIALQ